MKRDQKRMNILTMALSCIGVLALVFMTGCGNGCGQTFDCNSTTYEEYDISYVSVPLCGGCSTSGWGCTSFLWGENCLASKLSFNVSDEDKYVSLNCIENYYGNDCLGCGSNLYYIYLGAVIGTQDDAPTLAVYLGDSQRDYEDMYGCVKGGCACSNNDEHFGNLFVNLTEIIQQLAETE